MLMSAIHVATIKKIIVMDKLTSSVAVATMKRAATGVTSCYCASGR
jgi:hypothetical protein